MVALVVVVLDEGLDLLFEIAGQEVVLQQHTVFERLVPAFDLALGLGMEGRTANVIHLLAIEIVGQFSGDYVLAHAYLRDDNVLDPMLPNEIPIPPIAEVQTALFAAAMAVTGQSEGELKKRLRTGTVVTTDDRNWELNYARSAQRFNQSRAVAIDMESATMAAQGYRFRVPYGTLLCVSDKPLHGELKLPGQANAFYERSVSQHLRIGIEALHLLKEQGDRLHSRKLRSFDEPPFR